jgi:hypothetical protein
MPPIPLRPVSGRYRGRRGDVEVILRVDVDGARPTYCVSADYFEIRNGESSYIGSMCAYAPAVSSGRTLLTITGTCRSSWATDANVVEVTIRRVRDGTAPLTATLRHRRPNGTVRARFECTWECASFRTVVLEEDSERGVQRFSSYATGSLPAGCPPQTLTHRSAFEAAGIEFERPRTPGVIESADVAANTCWSDAELHAAMVRHFSMFADIPQWAIWMLHARLHDLDRASDRPRIFGMMFDQRGSPRQGCALFYQGMGGTGPQRLRAQLYTGVHELGHCFNLLHTSQKSLATPAAPGRPRSASWMTEPERFPGGSPAFWSRFAFQFDDLELLHLRHGLRDDVIMGGNAFAAGAALEGDVALASEPADPGVRLELKAPPRLPFGVPVTVAVELSGTTREGRRAPRVIGPRPGNVDITIVRPDGTAFVFEPLVRHCRLDDAAVLRAGGPRVRDNAFVHYGKGGLSFDRPGRYELTACYAAPDGALARSDVVRIDVRAPITRADRVAADLALGDEQGQLMSLVGSDAPELRSGNEALRTLVERFPNHPVARVPRLLHATNEAREFKAVQPDGSVTVRAPRPEAAAALLAGEPGLEALRAAAVPEHRPARPRVAADLLRRVRTDRASAAVLHPYLLSRIDEIAHVIPQVLAPARPPRPRRHPVSASER